MRKSQPGGSGGRPILWVIFGMLLLVGAVIAFVTVRQYETTGEWKLPTTKSMVQISSDTLSGSDPSRVVYLHRGAIEIAGGVDDAPNNRSSIVSRGSVDRVVMPGFTGSNKQWRAILTCTKKMFAAYDVKVTDALPITDDYILVAIGGKAGALKQKKHGHASGLAPFIPNKVIPRAVVFAFSSALKNKTRAVCETIAMEVAHAYGMDHGYNCKDVMTYLKRCGSRSFTDKDAPCGEEKARECAGGNKTQNSHQYLLGLLGASKS